MPPQPVQCKKCEAWVAPKKFCAQCGENLVVSKDDETVASKAIELRNFFFAAEEMYSQFSKIVLARLQMILIPNDGTLPRIKPLQVAKADEVFFAPSERSDFTALPPGTHTVQSLFSANRGATTVESTRNSNYGLFIHVNTHPLTVTFQLPDWKDMEPVISRDGNGKLKPQVEEDHFDFKKTLEQVNVRSADFFFGGAQVQVKLRVKEPTRFLYTLSQYMVECLFPTDKRETVSRVQHADDDKRAGGVFGSLRRFGRAVVELFIGRERTAASSSNLFTKDFHLAHLHERTRMEFLQAVQQAVQSLRATDLLENKDNTRKAVGSDIKKFMSDTLEGYGIEVIDVPAFEFLCPDLFSQQRAQGEIELRKKWLNDQRTRMELNRATTALAVEQQRFDDLLEFEDQLTKIAREGVLEERRGRNADAAQLRELGRDERQSDHDRKKELLDGRQGILLDKERGLAETDVTRAKREAELDAFERWAEINASHSRATAAQDQADLLAILEMVAKLPPALQTAALNAYQMKLAASRPQLAGVIVAAQQAAAIKDQAEREKEHAKALADATKEGTGKAVELLKQIVQQAGAVATAAVSKQPVISLPFGTAPGGTLPLSGPSGGPEETEGGTS